MACVWKLFTACIKAIITPFLRLVHIEWTETQWERLFQFIKFGLVGVSNTLLSYVIYLICIQVGLYYLYANFIAFCLSVLNSFFWNNKYVFVDTGTEKRSWVKTLCKTALAYSTTGLLLNSFLLIVWVDYLHISEQIAPLICLLITIPLNFILNKWWAFQK